MEKTIKFGTKEVRLDNNVAWTMEYKNQFNKDIVPALLPVISSIMEMAASVLSEAGAGGEQVQLSQVADAVQGKAMDIMLPLFQVEFVDVVVNVTWAMAKAADPEIAEPKLWVRQFDEFPLDIIVPEVAGLIAKGFVSSKNLKRLKAAGKQLKNLQPSRSTKSSSQESSEG